MGFAGELDRRRYDRGSLTIGGSRDAVVILRIPLERISRHFSINEETSDDARER